MASLGADQGTEFPANQACLAGSLHIPQAPVPIIPAGLCWDETLEGAGKGTSASENVWSAFSSAEEITTANFHISGIRRQACFSALRATKLAHVQLPVLDIAVLIQSVR